MQRSSFLLSAAAASAAAFLRTWGLAAASSTQVEPQFSALVATLAPPGIDVAHRIEELFHLQESREFPASLQSFSTVSAFSAGSPELFELERFLVEGADPERLIEADRRAFDVSGLPAHGAFANLDSAGRSTYMRLWVRSAFCARRRFYMSMRAVTFAALYSLRESWSAIGYEGPLIHRDV